MADGTDARPTGTTAGTLMVVSGAFNLMWASGVFLIPCIGTFAVLPALAGIAELVVGTAILGKVPNARVQLVSLLGLISGILVFNPVSVGLEVASLVTQSRKPKQIEGPR